MARLARWGMCGSDAALAKMLSGRSRPARPTMPKPVHIFWSISRRFMPRGSWRRKKFWLVHIEKFVRGKKDLGVLLKAAHPLARWFVQEFLRGLHFPRFRVPSEEHPISPLDLLLASAAILQTARK